MAKPDHISEDCVSYESLPADRLADAKRQGQAQFDSILELVEALREAREPERDGMGARMDGIGDMDDEKEREEAEQRIHEDALSVEVRSDWHAPGIAKAKTDQYGDAQPAEYRILLCTGGPACQIVGELNEHCEPETARMQVQDWFQPWTDMRPIMPASDAQAVRDAELGDSGPETAEEVMLEYARCFWFGE